MNKAVLITMALAALGLSTSASAASWKYEVKITEARSFQDASSNLETLQLTGHNLCYVKRRRDQILSLGTTETADQLEILNCIEDAATELDTLSAILPQNLAGATYTLRLNNAYDSQKAGRWGQHHHRGRHHDVNPLYIDDMDFSYLAGDIRALPEKVANLEVAADALAASIAAETLARDAAIAEERLQREAADAEINTRIDLEEASRAEADSTATDLRDTMGQFFSDALSALRSDSDHADTRLNENIHQEVVERTDAVTGLVAALGNNAQDIESNQNDITANNQSIIANSNDISLASDQFNTNGQSIAGNSATIFSNSNNIDSNRQDINLNQFAIQNNTGRLDAQSQRLDNVELTLADFEGEIEQITLDAAATKLEVNQLFGSVGLLQSDVAGIAENSGEIETLRQQISTVIADATTARAALDLTIEDLGNELRAFVEDTNANIEVRLTDLHSRIDNQLAQEDLDQLRDELNVTIAQLRQDHNSLASFVGSAHPIEFSVNAIMGENWTNEQYAEWDTFMLALTGDFTAVSLTSSNGGAVSCGSAVEATEIARMLYDNQGIEGGDIRELISCDNNYWNFYIKYDASYSLPQLNYLDIDSNSQGISCTGQASIRQINSASWGGIQSGYGGTDTSTCFNQSTGTNQTQTLTLSFFR